MKILNVESKSHWMIFINIRQWQTVILISARNAIKKMSDKIIGKTSSITGNTKKQEQCFRIGLPQGMRITKQKQGLNLEKRLLPDMQKSIQKRNQPIAEHMRQFWVENWLENLAKFVETKRWKLIILIIQDRLTLYGFAQNAITNGIRKWKWMKKRKNH